LALVDSTAVATMQSLRGRPPLQAPEARHDDSWGSRRFGESLRPACRDGRKGGRLRPTRQVPTSRPPWTARFGPMRTFTPGGGSQDAAPLFAECTPAAEPVRPRQRSLPNYV